MYAHAGAGELHIEPMINLKTTAGKQQFRTILAETAALVKNMAARCRVSMVMAACEASLSHL